MVRDGGSTEVDIPQSMARALAHGESLGSVPVVLLEEDDGVLEVVDDGGGAMEGHALAGARLVELVVAQDLPALRAARDLAREEQRQRGCQVRLATEGASSRWFEVRYVPGVSGDGMLVLFRDVTHLRRLASEAAVLRRVTELANSVTDADDAIARAVADLRATLGWLGGRVLRVADGTLDPAGGWATAAGHERLQDLVVAAAPQGLSASRLALERGVPVTTAESNHEDELAPEIPGVDAVTVVAVPVMTGDDVARVLEFYASSDAVVDDDQRSLLAEVGRQLGWVVVRQRSLEELEASHTELARSNAELERFAYVASHDLQEPLRKIVGFTELLQDHHEPIDEDEADYRTYVVESAHRLQRLIKDLLAYSRAGRRELARERVDLQVVMDEVRADLALVVEEADATIEVGNLPTVTGDHGQLREVFQNLVSNALKYRAEDRAPVVRIWEEVPDHEPDDIAHVVAADNGIGIEPGQREAVFEVFRRLHPAHAYSGTGLGLALVQRIVNRHGGSVTIGDSPLGEGIAVHLTLPRHQEQP